MKGRIFEAGHTTAPDHMPDRTKIPLASKGASTHVRPDRSYRAFHGSSSLIWFILCSAIRARVSASHA